MLVLSPRLEPHYYTTSMAKVSIIVCTYNRKEHLEVCLNSIPKLTADTSLYEIIVVNNNCTDGTDILCRNFAETYPNTPFRQVIETKQGLGHARNKGIAEAQGDIISFIDDDAEATPNFVESIISAFDKLPRYNTLGGKVLPVFEGGMEPKWMSKYMVGPISKVDYGDVTREFPTKYPAGCNMVFRKFLFEKYGNFNGQLSRSDDKDMFLRLKKHGEKVLYAADVVVYHHIPEDRITYESILKIGYSNGRFEALRLKDSRTITKALKLAELAAKFCASIAIGCGYFIQFKKEKGSYLIPYMYKMLLGYIRN